MKYLKKFDTDEQYKEYINSNDAVFPNVSLCTMGGKVYYNDVPRYIYYTATSKLPEVETSSGSGLHINAFNTNIISHTFSNEKGKIEFEDAVTEIGNFAFYNCSSLTSIEIPNSVTLIDDYAFYGCSGLTSIEIPLGVTSIYNYAFMNCSSLTSVTIPSSVTSINSSAFNGCSALESIIVDSNNIIFDSRNNCNAIIKTNTNQLIVGCKNTIIPGSVTSIGDHAFYGCSALASITIPNSVTSIGSQAFYNCSTLASITIPNSVTLINTNVFYGCQSLTSITIPSSVTSIGSYSFMNCSSLTSVTIPNSVTSIGIFAFNGCSALASITIPNSVTSIGSQAFRYCTTLTSVIVLATTPPTLSFSAFNNNASGRKIYVPASSVSAYQSANNWSTYASYIEPIPQQINLLDNADNSTTLNTWNGVTLGAKLKDRTLYKDGEFNTICLPFDLDTLVGTPLEGAHLVKLYNTVFNSKEDALTINLIPTNNILAGTPYFIWWDRASDYVDDDEHNLVEPIFSGVTINNKLHPTESRHLILKGTYSSVTLEANSDNFWVGSDGILYYPEEAITISSFRAYFEKVPSSDFQKTSNASTNILSAD